DGLAGCVLAEPARPAAICPAREAAEMVDAGDPPPEFILGQGLHHLSFERVQAVRHRAAHCRGPAKYCLDSADLHRGIDLAARVRRLRRVDGAIRNRLRRKFGEASTPTERGWRRGAAAAGKREEGCAQP